MCTITDDIVNTIKIKYPNEYNDIIDYISNPNINENEINGYLLKLNIISDDDDDMLDFSINTTKNSDIPITNNNSNKKKLNKKNKNDTDYRDLFINNFTLLIKNHKY